jgi:hypothetical protein
MRGSMSVAHPGAKDYSRRVNRWGHNGIARRQLEEELHRLRRLLRRNADSRAGGKRNGRIDTLSETDDDEAECLANERCFVINAGCEYGGPPRDERAHPMFGVLGKLAALLCAREQEAAEFGSPKNRKPV